MEANVSFYFQPENGFVNILNINLIFTLIGGVFHFFTLGHHPRKRCNDEAM